MSRPQIRKRSNRALLSLLIATPLLMSCASGRKAPPIDDVASVKVVLENVHTSVFVLSASSCGSKRREAQIDLISKEVGALFNIYERKFGVRPEEEMILIEGDGCMGYYSYNLRMTVQNLERARAFLNRE